MRELKFRAWNKHGFWMYGGLVYRKEGDAYFIINPETLESELVDPLDRDSIGQFTGLKDKNGKMIYEGDIVKYKFISGFDAEDDYQDNEDTETHIQEVKFSNGEFTPKEGDTRLVDDGFYSFRYFDFEVIGNIWENPEFLKNSIENS